MVFNLVEDLDELIQNGDIKLSDIDKGLDKDEYEYIIRENYRVLSEISNLCPPVFPHKYSPLQTVFEMFKYLKHVDNIQLKNNGYGILGCGSSLAHPINNTGTGILSQIVEELLLNNKPNSDRGSDSLFAELKAPTKSKCAINYVKFADRIKLCKLSDDDLTTDNYDETDFWQHKMKNLIICTIDEQLLSFKNLYYMNEQSSLDLDEEIQEDWEKVTTTNNRHGSIFYLQKLKTGGHNLLLQQKFLDKWVNSHASHSITNYVGSNSDYEVVTPDKIAYRSIADCIF